MNTTDQLWGKFKDCEHRRNAKLQVSLLNSTLHFIVKVLKVQIVQIRLCPFKHSHTQTQTSKAQTLKAEAGRVSSYTSELEIKVAALLKE